MAKGYVALVLHAHLPYVRHPENENVLEERWLFEAISESYIPLLNVFEALRADNAAFRLTMSMTPPLLSMLSDKLLQSRYINYVNKLIELCGKELERTSDQPQFRRLAEMYLGKYKNDLYVFRDKYDCDLVAAFKRLQDAGCIEIMACAATHGFLPLLGIPRESLRAQIGIGVKTHERFLGRRPRGIWLPECGYTPEVEAVLKEFGIEYFIMESHGLLYADPRPVFGTYAPVVTPNGITTFARDAESSRQVWSAQSGYPGDPDYREFYRDIGYDLEFEYIKDYISEDGARTNTGLKYYRITGGTGNKQPYDPEKARIKAALHAGDFIDKRRARIVSLSKMMNRPPVIVCPYDAELFGHWWYEGPQWLDSLFRRVTEEQSGSGADVIELTTLGEFADRYPVMQVSSPCPSSWGHKGYNEVWLNGSNDWIYRHLHRSAERMVELANDYPDAAGIKAEALNQAARELLLAQSSDWAFIMRTGTMVPYAEKRFRGHISRFERLYSDIRENSIDEAWLKEIANQDNIFPDIDYRIYSS